MDLIRVLFVSDTHLGFDHTFRPRVERRRRGPDFFNNFNLALEPARAGAVDAVVHGGDLLYRRRVPPNLMAMALEPLLEVADRGVPVFLVPGNHEHGALPHALLARHEHLHVFDGPASFRVDTGRGVLALAGFPYAYDDIRKNFKSVLARTGWPASAAGINILCTHHCVEGATVGPGNYTFRYAPDVIRAADLPRGMDAVLCGHVHRFQVLETDLRGAPLAAPVFYAGSVERTSFAEMGEAKGYLILEFNPGLPPGRRLASWKFHELPTRPMIRLEVDSTGWTQAQCERWLTGRVRELPADAIAQIRVAGPPDRQGLARLSAARLRELAPATMNIEIAYRGKPAGQG